MESEGFLATTAAPWLLVRYLGRARREASKGAQPQGNKGGDRCSMTQSISRAHGNTSTKDRKRERTIGQYSSLIAQPRHRRWSTRRCRSNLTGYLDYVFGFSVINPSPSSDPSAAVTGIGVVGNSSCGVGPGVVGAAVVGAAVAVVGPAVGAGVLVSMSPASG